MGVGGVNNNFEAKERVLCIRDLKEWFSERSKRYIIRDQLTLGP